MGVLYQIEDTSLCERVDEVISSHKHESPLLHSASVHVAIAELIGRNDGLEEAIRVLAREIQDLAAEQNRLDTTS